MVRYPAIRANWCPPVYLVRAEFPHFVSSNFNPAAATFSSRLTLEVPGIGSQTGDRASRHASVTWDGVAFHGSAARVIGLSSVMLAKCADYRFD